MTIDIVFLLLDCFYLILLFVEEIHMSNFFVMLVRKENEEYLADDFHLFELVVFSQVELHVHVEVQLYVH